MGYFDLRSAFRHGWAALGTVVSPLLCASAFAVLAVPSVAAAAKSPQPFAAAAKSPQPLAAAAKIPQPLAAAAKSPQPLAAAAKSPQLPAAAVKPQPLAAAAKSLPAQPANQNLLLYDAATSLLHDIDAAAARQTPAWNAAVLEARTRLGPSPSAAAVHLALADLFGLRGGLAPRLVAADEQAYGTLLSSYRGDLTAATVPQIGAWFTRFGKRWFIRDIFALGPAADAGLRAGDEILSVNGQPFNPVTSFTQDAAKPASQVRLVYRRLPWQEKPLRVTVSLARESLATTLLRHLEHGQMLRTVAGKQVLYVPLPLTSLPQFRTALLAAAHQAQQHADAMVLDLRHDFGGGGLTYMETFFAVAAADEPKNAPQSLTPFTKSLIVLVDHGTSGGREQLAAFLQQQKRGTIIGTPTAGMAAPGQLYSLLSDAAWLFVPAVPAAPPVIPDISSEAPLVYSAGSDEALDLAFTVAAKAAS